MARSDFGTFLLLLHYARAWQALRGPVCVVVLTAQTHLVKHLAQMICPEVKLICPDHWLNRSVSALFGYINIQFYTLNRIYCRMACRWPYSVYIYDQPIDFDLKESVSRYVRWFDDSLSSVPSTYSQEFINSYTNAREILDYRLSVFRDLINLHYKFNVNNSPSIVHQKSCDLLDKLKIRGKYVVLNVNCKDYTNKFQNRRRVLFPERYNSVIDLLIANGYTVVIQGRSEQPRFDFRKGLVDYSKSDFCSAENDLILYSRCEFGIMSKTGAEIFSSIYNVPVLGLNYVELCSMPPHLRFRFFPKHLWDRRRKCFLDWRSVLHDSSFFDIGKRNYNLDLDYIELEENELINATEEFLSLISKPTEKWLEYTPSQLDFKNELIPLHLDLYSIKGVPCEAYLQSEKTVASFQKI